MKYIKTYKGLFKFNESKIEDIEDCCLEIFDLGLDFEIQGAYSDRIKLVGEIKNEKVIGLYTGTYTNKLNSLYAYSHEKTPLNTSGQIVSNPILNNILNTIPSVLNKLKTYVIGDKQINFTVNSYSVEIGTCIVILIEWN